MNEDDMKLRERLDSVLIVHRRPKLTDNGFMKGNSIKLSHVRIALDWITSATVYDIVPTQKRFKDIANRYAHSYAEKHYLQKVGTTIFGLDWYVSNGAFIAAAYIADLDVVTVPGSPNAYIPIKHKSLASFVVKESACGSSGGLGDGRSWKVLLYGAGVELVK